MKRMMHLAIGAGVAAATLTGTMLLGSHARAQVSMGDNGKALTPIQMQAAEEEKRRAENDRAYQATMRRSRGSDAPAASNDPWAGVREQPQKKPAR